MILTAVGNYPKIPNRPTPHNLRQALHRFDQGKISAQKLSRIEDEVIKEVLAQQVEAGLDLVTDGQIRGDKAPRET